MFTVTRSEYNPVLSPVPEHPWEAEATFNGSPIQTEDGVIHLVYRAMSGPDPLLNNLRMSVIGCASSRNGNHFENRRVLVAPDQAFDAYGAEDPRVTKIENTYYIFYTALGGYPFSADNVKVAVALSPDLKTISEKHLVTPFNAKAMTLFPEKIQGKYYAMLTVDTDKKQSQVCIAEFDSIQEIWSPEYWRTWYSHLDSHALSIRRKDNDWVEVGSTPVRTEKGWLVLYSHIQHYGTDHPIFGIEALLLDRDNPKNILGRTHGPFLVPEEYYEKIGMIPNIVFPSGAYLEGNTLHVYYGATDMHCAHATLPLDNLLAVMFGKKEIVIRYEKNPILSPRSGLLWEAGGTLNPTAIEIDGLIYILYRSATTNNQSSVGLAISRDGYTIDERLDTPIYVGRAPFEMNPKEGNQGTEDARIMRIGDTLYMTYTAYNGSVARVAVTSISVADFVARRFEKWAMPKVLTPESVHDKDSCIFERQIDGKYMVIHRIGENICADFVSSLDFKEPITKCIHILGPRRGMWDSIKVGLASPLIDTPEGIIMFYHGISDSKTYRVGAVLLDRENPTVVLARSAAPIFEPTCAYEKNGIVSNVVFPCGTVVRGNTIFMYYGAADFVSGVVTLDIQDVLRTLKKA